MMHLLILLGVINKGISETIVCDGVIFNQVYYDREILFKKFDKPYNLAAHRYSGMLFFSYTINKGTHVDFGIKACHLKNKKCTNVKGLPGGYAIGYDAGNDDIYLGGHDGIYKYNFLTKEADFFAEHGKSIWAIFVRRNFYYIEYPSQKLYVYQDENFVKVAEAMNIEIDHFFISRHKSVYFANRTALYKVEYNHRNAIVLDSDIVVRQIDEDSYGDVYFCARDGIYMEEKPYVRLKRVIEIDQAYGLTFDENDQMIYSDATSIYRLKASNVSNICYEAIHGKTEVVESEEMISPRQWSLRHPEPEGKHKFLGYLFECFK